MYKIVLLVVLVIFTTSCSLGKPNVYNPNAKAFAEEDAYILFALRAEQIRNYAAASALFEQLYIKSKKKEYLHRSLKNDLVAKQNEILIKRVDSQLEDGVYDAKLIRLKIIALIDLNRLDEARNLGVELAAKTKKAQDYLLTSDVYIKRQEFDLAVKYLESAYALDNNEKILDKISIILYVNLSRKKEAIAHLETHSRMLGCSKLICSRLIAIYSNENNIDGLLSTSLRLYEFDKTHSLAIKIIQYYSYKRDYINLISFLEESGSDDEVLLQLYSTSKNYVKAQPLADKLYKQNADINYLGQSAIFEYEGLEDNSNKKVLDSVVKKLEKVVSLDPQPVYLNYLGYILIDHGIDIKKGMSYIDDVLKLQPNSGYYLDSKAWGYYKLGNCKKAKVIMNHVLKLEGGTDEEVKEHVQKIEQCLQKKKTNKGKKRK